MKPSASSTTSENAAGVVIGVGAAPGSTPSRRQTVGCQPPDPEEPQASAPSGPLTRRLPSNWLPVQVSPSVEVHSSPAPTALRPPSTTAMSVISPEAPAESSTTGVHATPSVDVQIAGPGGSWLPSGKPPTATRR